MKTSHQRNLIGLIVLLAASAAALALAGKIENPRIPAGLPPSPVHARVGVIDISAHLVQTKVLQGSAGTVGMELALHCDAPPDGSGSQPQNVDMVIVLDRSGSMTGPKIEDARRAVLDLIGKLSGRDRLALFSYAEGVQKHFDLLPVSPTNRRLMETAVRRMRPGGGTNLGAGLAAGIGLLREVPRSSNLAKLILISDGMANKGIVDPGALGGMAAGAVAGEFAVSTVGVGDEFNEALMAAIADRGTGNYYYLDDPGAFAEVFDKEFHITHTAAVTGLTVSVPAASGIALLDASGYPLTRRAGWVDFHPGSLAGGQQRRIFLTFRVPTAHPGRFEIGSPTVSYRYSGEECQATLPRTFTVACVADETQVLSSIDRDRWQGKVLQEDFNRLKEEVAADIKAGDRQQALERIDRYYRHHARINAVMASEPVRRNLDEDVAAMRGVIGETFSGAPAAVVQKQKSAAKAMQYDGYSGRRSQ